MRYFKIAKAYISANLFCLRHLFKFYRITFGYYERKLYLIAVTGREEVPPFGGVELVKVFYDEHSNWIDMKNYHKVLVAPRKPFDLRAKTDT